MEKTENESTCLTRVSTNSLSFNRHLTVKYNQITSLDNFKKKSKTTDPTARSPIHLIIILWAQIWTLNPIIWLNIGPIMAFPECEMIC